MTDPTQQTTPTRDEAVQNAADRMREFMEGARIGFATVPVSHIAEWRQLLSRLASAPAPASGRVDAVRAALSAYVIKPGMYEGSTHFARGQSSLAVDMIAFIDRELLSPAKEGDKP